MNFDKVPNLENKKKNSLLDEKLRNVRILEQQLQSSKTNQEYSKIQKEIKILYTENNNELLDYEESLKI